MRRLHLTPEERIMLQGVHAREQLLRPVVAELNEDREHVVRLIADRLGVPRGRLSFDAQAGVAFEQAEEA